jgi:tight adherence protein B
MTVVLLLIAAALVVAPRPVPATARLRLLTPGGVSHRGVRRGGPPAARATSPAVAAVVGGFAFLLVAEGVPGSSGPILPVLAGAVAGATVGQVLTTALARRTRQRAAAAQVDAVAAIAAEVRAGQTPDAALAAAGLRALPAELDAVWALSERSGAPVATVLDRLEEDLRGRTRRRQAVATQLAGARSTALLLAGLPTLGVALGIGMGAAPIPVLFGTTTGQLALLAGVVLDSAGVLWTARIVANADGDR